jgi:hypothetical protein
MDGIGSSSNDTDKCHQIRDKFIREKIVDKLAYDLPQFWGKTEECHLEEGKPQKPANGKKSGKQRKRARKAQNQKTEHSIWNQLSLTFLMQSLPLR